METHTRKYRLPDHGYTIVRWAHELAKGRGAVAVEPDVERVRRPDGTLAFADVERFKNLADGPLSILRELLDLEAFAVRSWAKTGFARFHRRAAARQADRICREQGSEAAVDWVLDNATTDEEPSIVGLRDALGARLFTAGGRDEAFYRTEVARCLQERRRRRQLNE
ncbi:hypothetical protein KIH27_06775 [Mycobacterium sp. M1]|uniref:Uncharacterized protein n=1 Tax=Mycolicibacter acidiphilus TaxID=2835306 RepID=A0ABS5RH19_9MYCO|nr:hypothetical protein [Mycolicibacter acidiphilus]MBS9533292.1 hypothetical protein [Mycolicibacter acidiphilus]